ncbi:MAG: type II toxin-antitoxin system HicA family toxin [Rivularia sp. (in: cyanobacteria)]
MFKNITFAELKKLLLNNGFQNVPTTGSHKIFQHLESDTLVVLPSYENERLIDTIHLVAVRRILIENDLIDENSFNNFAQQLAS